jgi:hypothetical protein
MNTIVDLGINVAGLQGPFKTSSIDQIPLVSNRIISNRAVGYVINIFESIQGLPATTSTGSTLETSILASNMAIRETQKLFSIIIADPVQGFSFGSGNNGPTLFIYWN